MIPTDISLANLNYVIPHKTLSRWVWVVSTFSWQLSVSSTAHRHEDQGSILQSSHKKNSGMVAHAWNFSARRQRQEDLWSSPAGQSGLLGKLLTRVLTSRVDQSWGTTLQFGLWLTHMHTHLDTHGMPGKPHTHRQKNEATSVSCNIWKHECRIGKRHKRETRTMKLVE